jgi:hypothetical protein
MTLAPYDAWVLARILADLPVGREMAAMAEPWRGFAERLGTTEPERRSGIFEGYSYSLPDPDVLFGGLEKVRPDGPPPESGANRPRTYATLADVRRLIADASWPWPGWMAGGALTSLAADPGIGKTLLAMSLARLLWEGRPWPDGQPNPMPARTPTLWVPGDHHYPQLLDLAERYGLPDDAVLLNSTADAPTCGHDLDDTAAREALLARIEASSPGLVIIDTVQMTTGRNLGKPEDAREYFGPLMEFASRTKTSFLLLTHLSKDAQALGRRIVGASRVVWKLTHPDPEGQPDRRRLWVDKSYALKPPAMGMTIGDDGCTFDFTPPGEPTSKRGPAPVKLEACKRWLIERLTPNPAPVKEIRSDAERAGYGADILYRAREAIGSDEYVVDRRKWWKLAVA